MKAEEVKKHCPCSISFDPAPQNKRERLRLKEWGRTLSRLQLRTPSQFLQSALEQRRRELRDETYYPTAPPLQPQHRLA